MSSVPPPVPPNSTSAVAVIPPDILVLVGPILVGSFMGWLLLGILTMQLYVYYVCFPGDRWWIKFSVYGLYVLDLVQTVFATNIAWAALVKGWGNPTALMHTEWGFSMLPIASGSISGWVQMFYAWRVWALGRSRFWTAVMMLIVVTALGSAGSAFSVSIKFGQINNIKQIHEVNHLVIAWLAASVFTDVLIAMSMIHFLISVKRNPARSKLTDKGITKLIRFTVETGLLSAAAAGLDLGLYLGFNQNNLHLTIAIMLSKLYSNALMASLNSRAGVYERDPSSRSRDETSRYVNTFQFTSVGIPTATDDSVSMTVTTVQKPKPVWHTGYLSKGAEKLTNSQGAEHEFRKTGRPHAGIALANINRGSIY